jgi:hypothetical protein
VPREIAEFLLTSSATDFHHHDPRDPADFRNVRIGRMTTPDGDHYLMCGEFLPVNAGGNAQWTPFLTIKTSGYEQWLGAQAAGYCKDSLVAWTNAGDLSSSLKSRLDSLR